MKLLALTLLSACLGGQTASFSEFKGATTVVVFISTKCPISNAYNERMNALYQDYSVKGVKLLFVNANSNESETEVTEHAKANGFAFHVQKDVGNILADRFGAQATPTAHVIDSTGILRYRGFIDDSTNPARIHVLGLRAALDAVITGKPVAVAETKAFGCSIKRVRN